MNTPQGKPNKIPKTKTWKPPKNHKHPQIQQRNRPEVEEDGELGTCWAQLLSQHRHKKRTVTVVKPKAHSEPESKARRRWPMSERERETEAFDFQWSFLLSYYGCRFSVLPNPRLLSKTRRQLREASDTVLSSARSIYRLVDSCHVVSGWNLRVMVGPRKV